MSPLMGQPKAVAMTSAASSGAGSTASAPPPGSSAGTSVGSGSTWGGGTISGIQV